MLYAQNVTIGHGHSVLCRDITFGLEGKAKKRIALLGANGAGKSTLFRVLLGEEDILVGTYTHSNELIGYLPQHLVIADDLLVGEWLEDALEEPWMLYKIEKLFLELGLSEDLLIAEFGNLSGGERLKVSILRELLKEPTVLLLDEPTNHIDQEGILWLGKFLKTYAGSVVMISHDRAFIAEHMKELWIIEQTKTLVRFTGNFEEYLLERERLMDLSQHHFERRRVEVEALRKWLRANEFHPKFRYTARVAAIKKRLARAEAALGEPPEVRREPRLATSSHIVKPRLVLKLRVDSKELGGKTVLQDVMVSVRHGDRVHIKGPNGAGKTTLLRIISGDDCEFSGEREYDESLRVGVLSQESLLPEKQTILTWFEQETKHGEAQARSRLASIGFDEEMIFRQIGTLSLGQRRLLELAAICEHSPDILLLDEPTNHLDVFMREVLENYLQLVTCAVVLISHDRRFLEKVEVNKVVDLG